MSNKKTNIKKMRKNLQRGDCSLSDLPFENISPRQRRKLAKMAVELTKDPDKEEPYEIDTLVEDMIYLKEHDVKKPIEI